MSEFKDKYFPRNFEMNSYRDRNFQGTEEEYREILKNTNTIYIGEMDSGVEEEQIWSLFGLVGEIKRVIMGINRSSLYPCGFAFVEFYNSKDAYNSCELSGFYLNNKPITIDLDYGFKAGRQYGRGVFGGTFKGDYKKKYGDNYKKRRDTQPRFFN